MDNIKKLDALVLKATGESVTQVPQQTYKQILQLVNSRADMPKHVIASISKRMILKNKRVLINIFTLLQYLVYECELSLYTQISTKQFLFKISGLLTNKQIDQQAKNKAMETIYCCQQLFRPHEDLIPLFFQFYAGMLRNGFDIPQEYKSPFRPFQLKQYKKPQQASTGSRTTNQSNPYQKSIIPQPTITEQKTFEEIRQKLILTNEIIDNANPGQNVKQNGLLIQMIQQIKQCEKKVNKTINQNPNQKIMELALAANDDIFITYRRFKDLQRNKKPEPFILTQLASDIHKERQVKKANSQNQSKPVPQQAKVEQKQSKQVNILDFDDSVKKIQTKSSKQQQNFLDMDFSQQQVKKQIPKNTSGDIFDLLGQQKQQPVPVPQNKNQLLNLLDTSPSSNPQPAQQSINFDLLQQQQNPQQIKTSNSGGFDDLLLTSSYQGIPPPSGFGITLNDNNLNANDFKTEADIKNYNNQKFTDKFQELTYQFLKK